MSSHRRCIISSLNTMSLGLASILILCFVTWGVMAENLSPLFSLQPDSGGTVPGDADECSTVQNSWPLNWCPPWHDGQNSEGQTFECKWTDLRLYTIHKGEVRCGIKFRLIVPSNIQKNPDLNGYPLYLSFAYRATEEEYPASNLMLIAQEGIIVATTSMRGQIHAYRDEDPLCGQSDWKGPEEMHDFDCLLWCFINGYILDELPLIDPARIGIGGASMGGITTFIYGRHTRIPDWTGYPIKVALPGGGAPSMGDWFEPGLDQEERQNWDITTFGAIRLSGLWVQMYAFQGDFLNELGSWIEDDVNGVEAPSTEEINAFKQYCNYRSGYDNYTDGADDVTSFLKNVKYGLIRIGNQDCIIPRNPSHAFFNKLYAQTVRTYGTATGGTSTILVDTGATFLADGVAVNDLLYNYTDDSQGIITAVNSETQVTMAAGMSSGTNDESDEYYIPFSAGLKLKKSEINLMLGQISRIFSG